MFASPGEVALQIGTFTIFWYGIFMALAIFTGLFCSVQIAKNFYPIFDMEKFYDLIFYVLIGGIIGARLYYVCFDWGYFSQNLSDIPKLWTGGLSIHGAILGGFLFGLTYVKAKKLNLWMYADITTFGLCTGQIIGRLGNFFNSEAFGRPTELPWKLFIPLISRPEGFERVAFYHPTFAYEMILNFFILVCLYLLLKKIPQRQYGLIFFSYLILYSIVRIFVESIRIDSVFNFLGIPIAIWASSILILIGITGLFWTQKKKGA
jgi:phosphatidylglycerol:prolipoprotein diacylglycerol transferase